MDNKVNRRALDLFSTGRYATRKEAAVAAREQIEREKLKHAMARTVFIPPLGAILPESVTWQMK